jgi:hypothetical protein
MEAPQRKFQHDLRPAWRRGYPDSRRASCVLVKVRVRSVREVKSHQFPADRQSAGQNSKKRADRAIGATRVSLRLAVLSTPAP